MTPLRAEACPTFRKLTLLITSVFVATLLSYTLAETFLGLRYSQWKSSLAKKAGPTRA